MQPDESEEEGILSERVGNRGIESPQKEQDWGPRSFELIGSACDAEISHI